LWVGLRAPVPAHGSTFTTTRESRHIAGRWRTHLGGTRTR
jgi:hypothetical protein